MFVLLNNIKNILSDGVTDGLTHASQSEIDGGKTRVQVTGQMNALTTTLYVIDHAWH